MANYSTLTAAVQAVVKTNGNGEITGANMQTTLLSMINSLGAGYQFMGVATPSTNPTVSDQKIFYICGQPGTYTNFNNLVSTGIAVLYYDTAWHIANANASGIVYDISAANGGAAYANLATALAAVPSSIRRGGMTVSFVQTSDNKYVQYRFLLSGSFTTAQFTNVDNWYKINIDRKPSLSADDSHAISSSRYAIDFQGATDLQEIEFTTGHYIINNGSTINPSSLGSDASYSCAVVPCAGGDIFVINGSGTTNARLWAFADSDNNNLMMSDAEITWNNQTVVAPPNAAYIVINIHNIGDKVSYKGKRFIDKMPCHIISNGQFKFALVDDNHNIIIGVDINGNVINYTKHIFSQSDISILTTNAQYSLVLTDKDGKLIFAIDGTGKIILNDIPKIIEDYVSNKIRYNNVDIVQNNLDKEPALYAASYLIPFNRYNRLPNNNPNTALYKKKFVLAWGTDFHGDEIAFQRFVEYINHYSDVIDGAVLTGDMVIVVPTDDGFKNTYEKYAPLSRKPILMAIGNHEVTGNDETLALLNSINDSDALFIQPYPSMYDSKGNGAYYYKDFTNTYSGFKFRVIVLNDYEMPRIVAGGKWETIDYDSTLSTYDSSHTYSVGDKCNLDGYSYKALTSTVGTAPNRTYIYNITGRYISQEQADWLVTTLNNTPSGYKVIVCSHMALDAIVDFNNKFTSSKAYNATSYAQNGFILTDILNAFINKTTLQQTYSLKEPTSSPTSGNTIAGYDVEVDADFSQAVADFCCSLSGHSHTDFTGKSQHLGTPSFVLTESGHLYNMDDLVKFGVKGLDCFNIISFDDEGVDIVRIGCDITTAMEKRDYMRFNI